MCGGTPRAVPFVFSETGPKYWPRFVKALGKRSVWVVGGQWQLQRHRRSRLSRALTVKLIVPVPWTAGLKATPSGSQALPPVRVGMRAELNNAYEIARVLIGSFLRFHQLLIAEPQSYGQCRCRINRHMLERDLVFKSQAVIEPNQIFSPAVGLQRAKALPFVRPGPPRSCSCH